jgi:hypothetical protein
MVKKPKRFGGEKPGKALVKWLNDPDLTPEPLEDLLNEVQIVFRWIGKYSSLHKLNVARREKKLPLAFWKSHERVNDTLAKLIYAPQIDLHEFPNGERVSRMLATDHLPTGLSSVQINLVVQLIEQGAILKVRRCQQCSAWFFARFSHQEYCTTSCRIKHLVGTEKFKKERREYMRKYNKLKKSGYVK